ncbi:hypothetical protein POM88_011281 [Heracleum sosnowskyi]|uniref:Seven-in-absentia protein TRAF-like domain-containing protein n=1 Tax=Heracleum sosnowskyi TaxID=360622 RepID=A0AAD8IUN4_9APIA|nr:hypothetical protein POM88_011281 [Heracleum sosnowskyi]
MSGVILMVAIGTWRTTLVIFHVNLKFFLTEIDMNCRRMTREMKASRRLLGDRSLGLLTQECWLREVEDMVMMLSVNDLVGVTEQLERFYCWKVNLAKEYQPNMVNDISLGLWMWTLRRLRVPWLHYRSCCKEIDRITKGHKGWMMVYSCWQDGDEDEEESMIDMGTSNSILCIEPEFMGGGTMFGGLDDTRITEVTEDFHQSREGLTQQVQTVDKKVEELGTKIDNIDVKFEELKQLIMGFQNQGSSVVKLESDAALKEDTESRSTCMEECHNFRPYSCPYAGSDCAVNGDVPFLVTHLRDDHKVDMHTGSTFNHRYVKSNPRESTNATWMLTVFHCFGQYFCLHFESFQLGMEPVYMAFLRLMGDEADARNYSYSLEVGGNGRKVIWEGTPRSIRDSHAKVRDSHDGLIIQRNMALFFSGGERKELKLRVTGRIWKEQNSEAGVCNTKSL